MVAKAAACVLLLPWSCAPGSEAVPTHPVSLRLGAYFPPGGRVGEYSIVLQEGFLVAGDLRIYGTEVEAAGYSALLVHARKHAGHPQGEADRETVVAGSWAVDLTREPAEIAMSQVPIGHYFDGSIRLRLCNANYAPVFAGTTEPVDRESDLWEHTLLLRGSATRDGTTFWSFQISVDVEAAVTGLEYAATVKEDGVTRITTRLDLAALLGGIDFAALADASGHVVLSETSGGDTYEKLKRRLQDPSLYLHEEMEAVPPVH